MKKKLFIIGGTGNVYLQTLYLKSIGVDFTVSKLLVSKTMRKVLSHTDHQFFADQLLKLNIKENIFINAIFILDIIIGKIFHKTFFTEVDLNAYKCKPFFNTIFYVGYFQEMIQLDFGNKNSLLKKQDISQSNYDLCIHYRGGDFIKYGSQIYIDYYKNALNLFSSKIDPNFLNVVVVTNDVNYCKKELKKLSLNFEYKLQCGNILDDFNVMMSSKHLITSNSTFSLVAALERSDKGITILPKEIFKTFHIKPDERVFKV